MSYPFVVVYPFMHVSELSEFIQSDVPSNNLLLIPNEFETIFERLKEIRRTRNTIFALAKPEQETISHNRLLEALTFQVRISRFFIAAICSIET